MIVVLVNPLELLTTQPFQEQLIVKKDFLAKWVNEMKEREFTLKEAMLFSQRMAQLSKALWKAIEKDWQQWIKPYDLNINEHHILWIAYHLKGASISDVAKFGVMHVSTAFNFSKKLEERELLEFSKRENDKRNTYIQLTDQGGEYPSRSNEELSA